MKKITIIYHLILITAVIILFYFQFNNSSNKDYSNKNNYPIKVNLSDLPDTSIAFVNSDTLWSKYQYVLDEKKNMEKERATKENAFNIRYKSFEDKVNRFREIAERLSQEEGQRQQMDLMQEEQSLNAMRDQMMEELMKSEEKKNEVLQNKILEYITRLNKESKNYTYVLGYSKGGGILYANPSLDITYVVLKGLNDEYAAKKK